MHAGAGSAWSVVVPVKRFAHAKSRLAPFAGSQRPALARAMALDAVSALLSCRRVAAVIAVTDDPDAARLLSSIGAIVVPDEPDAGLNPALRHGAATARARRHGRVAGVSADLPALDPYEFEAVLDDAARHPESFVADAAGTGTTTYCANDRVPFIPRFGARSAHAHALAGAAPLSLAGIASVRRDVDTEADLRAAIALGVGVHTRDLLARLELV